MRWECGEGADDKEGSGREGKVQDRDLSTIKFKEQQYEPFKQPTETTGGGRGGRCVHSSVIAKIAFSTSFSTVDNSNHHHLIANETCSYHTYFTILTQTAVRSVQQ